MSKKVMFLDWECDVQKEQYVDGSILLELTHPEDGPIATASTYLENFPIVEPYIKDHCWIKTWSENRGIVEALVESDIVQRTGIRFPVGGFDSVAELVKVLI